MRALLVMLMLAVSASYALAQDPAAQAAQQAAQQAQLNAQIAAQNAQQAAQMAAQNAQIMQQGMQQASQTDQPPPICCDYAAKPQFSPKPGTYTSPISVRISDPIRGAIIFYTTDGWSPTTASNRYLGPISVTSTTTVQAIALVPYYSHFVRSFIITAVYDINLPPGAAGAARANPPAAATSEAAPQLTADGKVTVLQGTPVPLIFGAYVTSKTALVGDRIPLTLADDLKVGNLVVAPKGSLTFALVTQADASDKGGAPGDITFEVDSLPASGTVIKLDGFATKEGEAKPPNGAFLIPVVGTFTLLKHGTEAEILKGTPFTAYVDADTLVLPAK
ncbi:MAG: chitobiase/beta-hexosaminidase C-terminal domain-containing protein [Candidatus Acidiferrales bacterium]